MSTSVGEGAAEATLGVVVVSHGTREVTLRCVETVLQDAPSVPGGARVVVVDCASPDGTVEALREAFGDRILLVASPVNLGFGRGCNRGAEAVGQVRHLLFLNADTAIPQGALAGMVAALDGAAGCGALGPGIDGDDGRSQPSVRGDPTPLALLHQHTALRFLRFGAGAYHRYKRPAEGLRNAAADVPVVMGAALLVRAADFGAVDGFDERYFLYFEEADLCRRLRDGGRAVRYHPAVRVRHEGGASSDLDRHRALVWYLQSLFRYVDRFHGRRRGFLYRVLFKPLFVIRMATDLLRDLAAYAFRPSRRSGKGPEIALGFRFFASGVWRFLLL